MASPELLVLGNLIVDDIVFPDGSTRVDEPGGAVLYAALAAALWGVRVGVVSVAGNDYPRMTLDALTARNIDVGGVRLIDGPGVRCWVLYERYGRRFIHQLGRPSHAEATPQPSDVPPRWASADGALLTPAPLDAQRPLALSLRQGRPSLLLGLDPHDRLREDTLESWRPVLDALDVLFLSEDELVLPGESADAAALALRVGTRRARHVALKRGQAGGVLIDPVAHAALPWAARASTVVDPTGAGDAFAGGFMAALVAGADRATAIAQAVVSASFAIEEWGAAGLERATGDSARMRLAQWFS